ncbi:MAG: carboxypeptidase-like regulatory domain-containing protein [Flammeovirgaceae bacterium]|nr:carboxypeptidase-like regulatory domain-containing protein [Flammeovirgaceae bacterium]
MRHIILLLTFTCYWVLTSAQTQKNKYILVDSSKYPIAYASILFLSGQGGTYSNEEGLFYLDHPDSIIITHLSYQTLKLSVDEMKDTIVLRGMDHFLDPVVITPDETRGVRRFKFSRKNKLYLNLPSFEIGIVIPKGQDVSNISIPYESPDNVTMVKLKFYSILNGIPDVLIYEEIVPISPNKKILFLSFSENLNELSQWQDSSFVSVELLDFGQSQKPFDKNSMKLFFHFKDEELLTFATRNFDSVKNGHRLSVLSNSMRNPQTLYIY